MAYPYYPPAGTNHYGYQPHTPYPPQQPYSYGIPPVAPMKPMATAAAAPPVPARPAIRTINNILVPMYIYPGGAQNERYFESLMAAAKRAPHVGFFVILNPNSGPGPSADPNYAKMAQRLKAAGCRLLCYIATTYAKKPEPKVLEELSAYSSQYPKAFEGVFFDEMSNEMHDARYYSSLTRQIHQGGFPVVVANPGCEVQESYFKYMPELPDVIVIHENSHYPTEKQMKSADKNLRARKAILVHSQPLDAKFVALCRQHCSMLFITDDLMPNPWDVLPSYWDAFVNLVAA